MLACIVDGRDRDGVDAIRVAIEVTLVVVPASVSTSEDKNRTFPATAVIDPVEHGFLDQVRGSPHCLSIVWRAPTTAVNRHVLETIVESYGFIDIRNGFAKNANGCYFGLVCNANTTNVILGGGDLPCTTGTVAVVCARGVGKLNVVIKIVRTFCILIDYCK